MTNASKMTVKYQVFVSSTFQDLIDEREQVLKATLEMGHIPVGMEMFSAADEQQWEIIKRQIDQSDYYVVIVAHRYGSTVEGVSYTEKEYDYAVSAGVPVIGFIIDDTAPWPGNKRDEEASKAVALADFKTKVKKKPVGFWKNAEELYGKYSVALMKLIASHPRTGWIPASAAASPEITAEITRLSSENAKLRKQLEVALATKEQGRESKRIEAVRLLAAHMVEIHLFYKGAKDWDLATNKSLINIFDNVARMMFVEAEIQDLAKTVAAIMKPKGKQLRETWPIPKNAIRSWLSYFKALGLVEPSKRKHAISDPGEYWSLTQEGHELLDEAHLSVLRESAKAKQEIQFKDESKKDRKD